MLDSVVAADGTRLHVIERGPADGDVVLAVHGFASSAEANWITAGWERPLTDAGYRLVAFDLRGHGASDRPADAEAYRLTTLADDALRVLDAVAAASAHWLGYSLGSRIGLEVARQAPGRLRTMNLGGTAGADPAPERLIAMVERSASTIRLCTRSRRGCRPTRRPCRTRPSASRPCWSSEARTPSPAGAASSRRGWARGSSKSRVALTRTRSRRGRSRTRCSRTCLRAQPRHASA